MKQLGLALLACSALTACDAQVNVEQDAAVQELADRIAIEDMIVGYYAHLGGGSPEAFADFYTQDAVFDLNGLVFKGHEEIQSAYASTEEGDGGFDGTFHMLLSNPVIEVDGDTATARFIWTGVLNPDPKAPPVLQEQGREYDLLERQEDGSWLIAKRTVIADSNIPDRYASAYTPRLDYDITAEEAPAAETD